MTKKEAIKATALRLFAEEGYNSISTSKIAKQADVSEALIFRHYKNKKGLLDSILEDVGQKVGAHFSPILTEKDPYTRIEKFISLVFNTDESEYDYWRLSFKLKWDQNFYKPDEMKPILQKVSSGLQAIESS